MKRILWYSALVEIAFFTLSAVMVAMTARAAPVTEAAPAPEQKISKAEPASKPSTIPDYNSGCTQVLTGPSVVYPGDLVTVTAKANVDGVCASAWVWMSYAVEVEIDGAPGEAGGDNYIYDYCYDGTPQPIVPGGVGVMLPDSGTHTITFYIPEDLLYSNCVREVENGTPCSSNNGNTRNVVGPAIVMSGSGGTHGWSTVKFYDLWVDQDIDISLNKTTFFSSDHLTVTANIQPWTTPSYPFVRIVTPSAGTYYYSIDEGFTEIPTPYLGVESSAIILGSQITGATLLDLSFAGLSTGTYYVESGTISPSTTDLNDLKYIKGVARKEFMVQ